MGASRAPGIPCAHCFSRAVGRTTRAHSCRGSVEACIACDKREAFAQGSASDEAIQRIGKLWIASLTLAMTIMQANWLFEIRIGNFDRAATGRRTPAYSILATTASFRMPWLW